MLALIAAALMTVSHTGSLPQARLQMHESISNLAQYCVPEHTDADRIFCHD
jgi:hypothetical protein